MTSALVTPSEILSERMEQRSSGRLAHTSRVDGSFMAWMSCPCYNCRDYLDPTGEEDANNKNKEILDVATGLVALSNQAPPTIRASSPIEMARPLTETPPASPVLRRDTVTMERNLVVKLLANLKSQEAEIEREFEALDHIKYNSHDEMAAADQQWEELEKKYNEVTNLYKKLKEAFDY